MTERLAWLEADLRALDVAPIDPDATASYRRARVDGPEGALGALYVLEGSSLGARALLSSIPTPGARTYLTRLGATTEWKAFTSVLESENLSSGAALVDGAVSTFESVFDFLTGRLLP